MKNYTIITGVLFGLLTVVHVWRIIVEGTTVANPWFIGITVISALIAGWSFRLARQTPR